MARGRKIGRRISAANEARIKAAIEHCKSSIDLLQKVLDGEAEDVEATLRLVWDAAVERTFN
jgi:hypothetical protein